MPQGAFDSFAMGNYPFPTYYIGGSAEHPLPAFPMRTACLNLGGSLDTGPELLQVRANPADFLQLAYMSCTSHIDMLLSYIHVHTHESCMIQAAQFETDACIRILHRCCLTVPHSMSCDRRPLTYRRMCELLGPAHDRPLPSNSNAYDAIHRRRRWAVPWPCCTTRLETSNV